MCKLDDIQTEAMRVVTGATARSNIQALYMDTKWQKLSERRKVHSLTMLYKIINGQAPSYLSVLLPPRIGSNNRHNLRNQNLYRVPFCRLETYRRSFFPRTLLDWNALDNAKKGKPTLDSFKACFREKKDPMKELLYYGHRWPSVHHSRIRMGCSKLNSHLHYNLHVVPSPQCPCGFENEDPTHFFFDCPLFNIQRQKLLQELRSIENVNICLDTLLWGDEILKMVDNEKIFNAVQTFIHETARF